MNSSNFGTVKDISEYLEEEVPFPIESTKLIKKIYIKKEKGEIKKAQD